MPLEVHDHTVPHLKALISGKYEPRGLRCGSSSRVCQTLLKSAALQHKASLVKTAVPREGVADEFVIDYYHCRIIDIQGLISIILQ